MRGGLSPLILGYYKLPIIDIMLTSILNYY